jgi:hypothetical protein
MGNRYSDGASTPAFLRHPENWNVEILPMIINCLSNTDFKSLSKYVSESFTINMDRKDFFESQYRTFKYDELIKIQEFIVTTILDKRMDRQILTITNEA